MLEGVSVVRSEKVKDELILDGNDIELVSRSCALINQVIFFFSLYLCLVCAWPGMYVLLLLSDSCPYSFMLIYVLCVWAFTWSDRVVSFLNRNAMSRTRISGNSLTVSMSVKRAQSWMKNDSFSTFCHSNLMQVYCSCFKPVILFLWSFLYERILDFCHTSL